MSVHRINLSGMWQFEDCSEHGHFDLENIEQTHGAFFAIRKFKCPTGLDGNSRIFLKFDQMATANKIHLNGTPLVAANSDSSCFEITKLLTSQNKIKIELHSNSSSTTPKAAHLEIHHSD